LDSTSKPFFFLGKIWERSHFSCVNLRPPSAQKFTKFFCRVLFIISKASLTQRCGARGSIAGETAQVYIGGDLQGPRKKPSPKAKWRCGDEEYALVSIGGVFGGGIADARDGNGAESV
jgi:hypothetical protein